MAPKRKAPAAAPVKEEPELKPEPEQPEPEQPEQEEELEEEVEEEEVEEEEEDNNNPEEEPEEEEEEDEPVEKLLEPFGKDQLVLLIKEAVNKHPDLISIVYSLADKDPSHRKIFVHGLGWETTSETLVSEFSKYGPIEDCKAVTDKITGKSKGYAFILFKHRSGAKKALVEPQKKIGDRVTSCQLASAGPVPAPPPVAPPVSEYTQRKIFISNVSADLDQAKLTDFFAQFGEIEEGPLGLDKVTGKPKGFCLFVYKSIDGAKKALEEPHKVLDGVTLHCYKAIDGPKPGHKGGFHGHQQNQNQFHSQSSKRFKGSGGKFQPRGGPQGGHGHQQQQHMMGPSGLSPQVATALAPALGQAISSILAGQGAGLGNLLGGYGGQGNQGMPPQQGYGVQPGGGYGMGGYPNQQMGGRPPYM